MSTAPVVDNWGFKRGASIYPYPVAYACGRVLRANLFSERIDTCLKAGEILTRYAAALAVASLRHRPHGAFPGNIQRLSGNLSWGHFLSLTQSVAKWESPLADHLSPFLAKKGKGGQANPPITALLNLRNKLGHALATLDKARAETILRTEVPERLLLDALGALDGILSLPLFVVDGVSLEQKKLFALRLLFMGENPDPIPDRIEISGALDTYTPYISSNAEVIALPPMVLYALIERHFAYRMVFLDSIVEDKAKLRFKSLDSNLIDDTLHHAEFSEIFAGRVRPTESVTLADGSSLHDDWRKQCHQREVAGTRSEGKVAWEDFCPETLAWYSKRLPIEFADVTPEESISKALLDGRAAGITERELRQLVLLFGQEGQVRQLLSREMSDFRYISEPGARWEERILGTNNILKTLVIGIEFFARHVGLDKTESADLGATDGSPDYIAMREALVNQFIHQDFSDASAAAQVELTMAKKAMFFNTGYSLVAAEQLATGGKSQSRNPLIARALRLIGFAELAGGGIRALRYAWRQANRQAPVLSSDKDTNTFSLTLSWDRIDSSHDEAWRTKLGVQLDGVQSTVLSAIARSDGLSPQQTADATGLSHASIEATLHYLVRQMLVIEENDLYRLQPHLKGVLDD